MTPHHELQIVSKEDVLKKIDERIAIYEAAESTFLETLKKSLQERIDLAEKIKSPEKPATSLGARPERNRRWIFFKEPIEQFRARLTEYNKLDSEWDNYRLAAQAKANYEESARRAKSLLDDLPRMKSKFPGVHTLCNLVHLRQFYNFSKDTEIAIAFSDYRNLFLYEPKIAESE